MSNELISNFSLHSESIDRNKELIIDPDNVFWAILKKGNHDPLTQRKILALYKKVKTKLNTQIKELRFKTSLNAVYLDAVDACNANCPYCYIPSKVRKSKKELSEEQLVWILKKLTGYFKGQRRDSTNKPVIIFHASEPLLIKNRIFNLIDKFNHIFHFGIQTNALLLEKSDIKFIKNNKVSVGISLDSCDYKVNNRSRLNVAGGGNFYKAVEAIEWFRGYEGLNVISTITKYNVKTLPQFVRFMHAKRVPCVLLNPVRTTRRTTVKLRPNQKDLTRYFIKAVEEAINISQRQKRGIIIGNFSNIVLGIVSPNARRLMCDISPCGGGRCFLTITSGGDMIPCGEFTGQEGFSGGNIFTSSVKEALNSPAFKKVRARVVEKIKECDECLYRNICGAPCPAEAASLNKDMYKISPYCDFFKELINYAFKLIAADKIKYLFHKDTAKNLKYEYNLRL
ncbi:MAG: peptide-modifying radical SAM enzyme CbpB [Candidatus Omnitrophica bacterium]|nr:peptide-modifying radical SAM enzyme CbpB [Candidatus Omnitrophota bacterium]